VRLQTFEPPQDTIAADTTANDTTVTDTTTKDSIGLPIIPQSAGPGSVTMHIAGHTLFIAGTQSAKVDVFDMQGRPVFSTRCEKGSVELNGISDGLYMVRVRSGSANLVQRIVIK
jgi:endo-1,4-beta-xylanase